MQDQRTETEFRWTDEDGAKGLATTDNETCGDGDAVAVLAIPYDAGTGGVFLTPSDARELVRFLQHALRRAER